MSLIKTSLKNKILISIALILIIAVGYYLSVYQAYPYQSSNGIVGMSLIMIAFIIFPLLCIDINKNNSRKVLFFVMIILIAFAVIIPATALRQKYERNEIASDPAYANARITGFESSKAVKSSTRHYATISYYFKNKKITQRIEYHELPFKKDQIIQIRFSRKYPEMFEMIK